jgi:valyl-tRNA synthetase
MIIVWICSNKNLYEFVWHDYCDWYLELSKSSVENDNTKYTLITVLDEILKLLHPIIPFITEEIFATFKDEKTLMEQNYPQVNKDLINKDAEDEVSWIKEFVLSVRKIRGDMNISPNKKLQVFVENPDENYLNNNANMIKAVAKLESIENLIDDNQEFASGIVGKMKVLIPLKGLIDKDAEIARLGKEIEKINQQIGICNNKLNNEKFVANAKPEVVQVERDRLSGFEEKLAGLESGLDKIKKL